MLYRPRPHPWLFAIIAAALGIGFAAIDEGCMPAADTSTVCGQATTLLGQCGVLLPLLQGSTCTGNTEMIAQCITQAGSSCDALAQIGAHLEECAGDGGSVNLPQDFGAVTATDGGDDDASAAFDSGQMNGDDGGAALPPITPPPADGGTTTDDDASAPDSGSVGSPDADVDGSSPDVLDVSGMTTTGGADQPFETPRLGPGNYTFTMSATGAVVELSERKGFAPTATTFDCDQKTTSAPAVCAVNVSKSAILFATVRGSGNASFHLVVTTEP